MKKLSIHTFDFFLLGRCSLAQSAGAALLLVLLAGCATQGAIGTHGASNVASMRGANTVGPELSKFLDDAVAGSAIQPSQSPWGPNAEIIIEQRYYAASGRTCAQLAVQRQYTPTALTQSELACRVEGQGWFTQRLVTDVLEADLY